MIAVAPICPRQDISEYGDSGAPYVVAAEGSAVAKVYTDLAEGVIREIGKLSAGARDVPLVEFDKASKSVVITPTEGHVTRVTARVLRDECRCAGCQQERRESKRLAPAGEGIEPNDMSPKGRYALSIEWSDGHSSIYTYQQLRDVSK